MLVVGGNYKRQKNHKNRKIMTEKNNFFEVTYEKLKTAINNIDEQTKKDIYGLSLWFYNQDDDPRFPIISVSYNTTSHFKKQISRASNDKEAKWNFAFWLQDEIEEIGGNKDINLKDWFSKSAYYYSDEENEIADGNKEVFEKILDLGEGFSDEFIEEIILLVQKLFSDKIVETKFGQNIPILVHELEYYDIPVSWTVRSNPSGLVDEFVKWTEVE
jgi:hypothetical protein